jgi:hypothetical protein
MEKEFVPYEQALALKKLGFDEPCFNKFYTKPNSKMFGIDDKGRHYPMKNTAKKLYTIGEHFVLKDDNVILAPLYQQAFRWFREKYGLNSHIHQENRNNYSYCCGQGYSDEIGGYQDFKTYEEAELECLKKLIEICKQNLE